MIACMLIGSDKNFAFTESMDPLAFELSANRMDTLYFLQTLPPADHAPPWKFNAGFYARQLKNSKLRIEISLFCEQT